MSTAPAAPTVGGVGRLVDDLAVDRHGVARAVAGAVPRGVVEDREQPRPQIGARLEAVRGAKRLQISFLHEIFGIGRHRVSRSAVRYRLSTTPGPRPRTPPASGARARAIRSSLRMRMTPARLTVKPVAPADLFPCRFSIAAQDERGATVSPGRCRLPAAGTPRTRRRSRRDEPVVQPAGSRVCRRAARHSKIAQFLDSRPLFRGNRLCARACCSAVRGGRVALARDRSLRPPARHRARRRRRSCRTSARTTSTTTTSTGTSTPPTISRSTTTPKSNSISSGSPATPRAPTSRSAPT